MFLWDWVGYFLHRDTTRWYQKSEFHNKTSKSSNFCVQIHTRSLWEESTSPVHPICWWTISLIAWNFYTNQQKNEECWCVRKRERTLIIDGKWYFGMTNFVVPWTDGYDTTFILWVLRNDILMTIILIKTKNKRIRFDFVQLGKNNWINERVSKYWEGNRFWWSFNWFAMTETFMNPIINCYTFRIDHSTLRTDLKTLTFQNQTKEEGISQWWWWWWLDTTIRFTMRNFSSPFVHRPERSVHSSFLLKVWVSVITAKEQFREKIESKRGKEDQIHKKPFDS